MKSPRWLSSSSPMGVSSETGSWLILSISRILSAGIPNSPAQLFGRRLAADLLHQPARNLEHAVDRLDHVHGDADGARLVGDGARDGLADPPCRIGGELVALACSRNFSTALSRPRLPSWIRSSRLMPRPVYFLATDTTSRKLASTRCLRAAALSSRMACQWFSSWSSIAEQNFGELFVIGPFAFIESRLQRLGEHERRSAAWCYGIQHILEACRPGCARQSCAGTSGRDCRYAR